MGTKDKIMARPGGNQIERIRLSRPQARYLDALDKDPATAIAQIRTVTILLRTGLVERDGSYLRTTPAGQLWLAAARERGKV